MAKLSKASFTPRSRPPRRDMYEVPTTGESEESGKYTFSMHKLYANLHTEDDNSPSQQLLREANTSPPPSSSIAPRNVTPDRPAPANNSTSSRKSVHFKDPIATESAGLLSLAAAKRGRGRPKGKLVRPSSFSAPISLKKPSPPLIKETRGSGKVDVEVEKASPKHSALCNSISEAQTSSPSANDNGERRSGRSRQNVATYNDTDNIRASAGYKRAEADVTTPAAKVDSHDQRGPGLRWKMEEHSKLKNAREAGKSWEEIQEVSRSKVTGVYISADP